MTSTSVVASGRFLLSFSTEQSGLTAAREASTRGFDEAVANDRWDVSARARSIVPLGELDRYASRLQRIATYNAGTYAGYTADSKRGTVRRDRGHS